MSVTKPRYQQLKDFIIEQISSGELRPLDRVPSENDLVESKSVSRMTANRALRELNDEGYVERIAGRGTFVSDFRSRSHLLEVQNIADEIASRGHVHSSAVLIQSKQHARGEIAKALHVARAPMFFTCCWSTPRTTCRFRSKTVTFWRASRRIALNRILRESRQAPI